MPIVDEDSVELPALILPKSGRRRAHQTRAGALRMDRIPREIEEIENTTNSTGRGSATKQWHIDDEPQDNHPNDVRVLVTSQLVEDVIPLVKTRT